MICLQDENKDAKETGVKKKWIHDPESKCILDYSCMIPAGYWSRDLKKKKKDEKNENGDARGQGLRHCPKKQEAESLKCMKKWSVSVVRICPRTLENSGKYNEILRNWKISSFWSLLQIRIIGEQSRNFASQLYYFQTKIPKEVSSWGTESCPSFKSSWFSWKFLEFGKFFLGILLAFIWGKGELKIYVFRMIQFEIFVLLWCGHHLKSNWGHSKWTGDAIIVGGRLHLRIPLLGWKNFDELKIRRFREKLKLKKLGKTWKHWKIKNPAVKLII